MRSLLSWLRSARSASRERAAQERLLADRIVTLLTPIDERSARTAIAQLLFLQHADPRAAIHLYVNSPGGALVPALALAETIAELGLEVRTLCLGRADGAAALVLASGAPGVRLALPSATLAMVPIECGDRSPAALAALDRILDRFAALTRRPRAALQELLREQRVLDAEGAKAHDLIDGVVEGRR